MAPGSTKLARLVKELQERESRLRTELLKHKILKEAAVEELRPVVAPTASEEIPSASAAASIVPATMVAPQFQSPANAREVLRRGVVMEEFGAQAWVHSKCSTKWQRERGGGGRRLMLTGGLHL